MLLSASLEVWSSVFFRMASGAEGTWLVSGAVWLACPLASDGYTVYSFLPTVTIKDSMITN